MSRERRTSFPPPYGRELPLPSDMSNDSVREVVTKLEILWMIIRQQPHKGVDVQTEAIGKFFEGLNPAQIKWLEEDDPQLNRPRAVLVKERAIQLCQRKDFSLLSNGINRNLVSGFEEMVNILKAKVISDI